MTAPHALAHTELHGVTYPVGISGFGRAAGGRSEPRSSTWMRGSRKRTPSLWIRCCHSRRRDHFTRRGYSGRSLILHRTGGAGPSWHGRSDHGQGRRIARHGTFGRSTTFSEFPTWPGRGPCDSPTQMETSSWRTTRGPRCRRWSTYPSCLRPHKDSWTTLTARRTSESSWRRGRRWVEPVQRPRSGTTRGTSPSPSFPRRTTSIPLELGSTSRSPWPKRRESGCIRSTEIDLMYSAFEHDDLALALSF